MDMKNLTQKLINLETEKADFLKTHDVEDLATKYTDIIEFTGSNYIHGVNLLFETIAIEEYGKVSKIGIVNYDVHDSTKPLIIKVYTDKWETCPVSLILIFNEVINATSIVTDIQLYCGHENTWYVSFE